MPPDKLNFNVSSNQNPLQFARRICSSLLSTRDDRCSLIFDVINYFSDFSSLDGKVFLIIC